MIFVSKGLKSEICFRVSLQEVKDKYSAVVKMIDSGDKLKLDQTHLETVIPAPGRPLTSDLIPSPVNAALSKIVISPPAGKRVLILNGAHRDAEALLEGIDEKRFSATLTLDSVSLQPGLYFYGFVDAFGVNKVPPSRLQGQQKGRRVDVAYEDFSKLA